MKYFTFLLFVFALLTSCKSENTLRDNATSPITPNASTAAPPAATANVVGGAHYICTLTGCTGLGASAAGNCTVCGNALAHNQGFHNQTATPGQTNNANGGLSPLFTTPGATPGTTTTPQTITPPTPEPAQNASGVWHYTCSNGCAGGAGSAVACASCGSTLVHNTAYH